MIYILYLIIEWLALSLAAKLGLNIFGINGAESFFEILMAIFSYWLWWRGLIYMLFGLGLNKSINTPKQKLFILRQLLLSLITFLVLWIPFIETENLGVLILIIYGSSLLGTVTFTSIIRLGPGNKKGDP